MKNNRCGIIVVLSLTLFLGAIFPASVSAEKWYKVVEDKTQKIEVDDDSLTLIDNNTRVQCWTRITKNNITAISLTRVDIPGESFAIGPTKLYNANGELVSSTQGDLTEYEPFLSDSLGMRLFYYVQAYHDVEVYPKPTLK